MKHSCLFIGYRETPQSFRPLLEETVERLIVESGVEYFIVGGYGGFDQMACGVVRGLQQKYGHISLVRLVPYYSDDPTIRPRRDYDIAWIPQKKLRDPWPVENDAAHFLALMHVDYAVICKCASDPLTDDIAMAAEVNAEDGRLKIIRL